MTKGTNCDELQRIVLERSPIENPRVLWPRVTMPDTRSAVRVWFETEWCALRLFAPYGPAAKGPDVRTGPHLRGIERGCCQHDQPSRHSESWTWRRTNCDQQLRLTPQRCRRLTSVSGPQPRSTPPSRSVEPVQPSLATDRRSSASLGRRYARGSASWIGCFRRAKYAFLGLSLLPHLRWDRHPVASLNLHSLDPAPPATKRSIPQCIAIAAKRLA
jgi:hypothetical protein